MHLLIIGGTKFVGRALVQAAVARQHRVTLFHRGQTNPELFPELEKIHGDRATDLDRLANGHWDVVIDTCGYVPRIVRLSAEALRERVGQYIFISTLSVYSDLRQPPFDETGALGTLTTATEDITGETYGPLKVLCEQAVHTVYGERATIVRPGLIVGPHDMTDRFAYWPHRFTHNGEILAPNRPERLLQFIDVRDLAEWLVYLAETRTSGVYNAINTPLPFSELIAACQYATGNHRAPTWVSDSFLLNQQLAPWTGLPLWIPESDPDMAGFYSASNARAVANGLRLRSTLDTVTATTDWLKTRPATQLWRKDLITPEREIDILQQWHVYHGE